MGRSLSSWRENLVVSVVLQFWLVGGAVDAQLYAILPQPNANASVLAVVDPATMQLQVVATLPNVTDLQASQAAVDTKAGVMYADLSNYTVFQTDLFGFDVKTGNVVSRDQTDLVFENAQFDSGNGVMVVTAWNYSTNAYFVCTLNVATDELAVVAPISAAYSTAGGAALDPVNQLMVISLMDASNNPAYGVVSLSNGSVLYQKGPDCPFDSFQWHPTRLTFVGVCYLPSPPYGFYTATWDPVSGNVDRLGSINNFGSPAGMLGVVDPVSDVYIVPMNDNNNQQRLVSASISSGTVLSSPAITSTPFYMAFFPS